MTDGLIPPTLDDIGHILWGANWREYLANILEVTKDDIAAWETEPSTRPAELVDALREIGNVRIQEIALIMSHLKITGLRTGPE
jgi:hypothetical protein